MSYAMSRENLNKNNSILFSNCNIVLVYKEYNLMVKFEASNFTFSVQV